MSKIPQATTVEEHRFADDGHVPNNPLLPLLVYRGVLDTTGAGAASSCMALFARHGWTGAWRNGIYAHHHYHSTAHEVLGIVAGSAHVRLGGEQGRTLVLAAGDVAVIPAGVAHKCETASPDLLVVGAYPRGQSPDIRQAGARERERALSRIAAVPLPEADPVHGGDGPLIERWRPAAAAR
ncbi:MAG TPA: cupin domain-containing protein [Stellaceae bacterium]|nr:cupin domain-containing protein [Stellaceae bacterium]